MTARFGAFELDPRSGELRRDGQRLPLQDQPFRLLSILLERPGDVVTREELRERLWPSEFVDFEHGLNTAVRKLRAALGDSADEPRFIETLARRGYRFIAPVTFHDQESKTEAASRRRIVLPLAIAALLVAALAVALALRRATPDQATIEAIAVLPFTYNDAQSEHIGDGLTEVLIDTLSRLPDLRVMASTTVFRYKDRPPDPKKVGDELDVGAVVVGDIRQQDEQYRIRVELINVRDGSRLWGDQFVVPVSELPAAQSRISDALTQRLRHGRRGPGAYTRNAEAYDLYLKGVHAWNQRTKENVGESVDYFTRAVDLDPTFAAAYAGLAHAWGVMVGNGLVAPEEGTPKIMAAARRALELDPASAEAYTSIGTTKYRNLWDFAGAEQDYRRAIALNPNYATAHQWYADYLRSMGRFEEGRRETELAYRLDPLSRPIHGAKCWSFIHERRYRDAIAFTRGAAELDERYLSVPCLMTAYAGLGDYDAIVALLQSEGGDDSLGLAEAYRRAGVRGLYEQRLKLLLGHSRPEHRFPVEIAETHAMLGNGDEAFRWLETAYGHRVSRLTSFHLQPGFDRLRDDPRFDDLVKRIGLPRFDPPATAPERRASGRVPATRPSRPEPDLAAAAGE